MVQTKTSVKVLGRSKLCYFFVDNIACINIDKLITRFNFNEQRVIRMLSEILPTSSIINLYALPELLYRLELSYSDYRVLQLLDNIKSFIIDNFPNHNIKFVQNNIEYDGYVDMQPIGKLISHDVKHNIIYIHRILESTLNMLGYQDSQLIELIQLTLDFTKILPSDLIKSLPVKNHDNDEMYKLINELIIC